VQRLADGEVPGLAFVPAPHMTHRYSLRFESGERSGETIPITGSTFTVGRRPGNSLQILENSVSGKHAELTIDAQGVFLRDLGSTNGTRVAGERVLETRVQAGADVAFGNVEFVLLGDDASTASAGSATAAATAAPAEPELSITADELRRSRKTSGFGLPLLVVLAAAGGGTWWFLNKGGRAGAGSTAQAAVPVDGNLLDDYSFEAEVGTWGAAEGAPVGFLSDSSARVSGESGMTAEVAAGEWARHESPAVRVQQGRTFLLSAELSPSQGASANIGIEFLGSGDDGVNVRAISQPLREGEGGHVELVATVPAGYESARAFVTVTADAGGSGGALDFDDVSLVTSSAPSPALAIDEYKLYAFGAGQHYSACLAKVARVFLSRIEYSGPNGLVACSAVAGEKGFLLTPQSGARTLTLRAEAEALNGGVAFVGAEGFATHSTDFKDLTGVTDLLFGTQLELVRVHFDVPVSVSGQTANGVFDLQVTGAGNALLQTRFREERAAAGDLAAQATSAERSGQFGECLRLWAELLANYPYESNHVQSAEETRGRLIRGGLDEVHALEVEVERARFFRLLDLFRQCRAEGAALSARYAGSDVDARVRSLIAEIDGDLAGLEADLDAYERERLKGILTAFEAQGWDDLASAARKYMSEEFGEGN
jgi:hypothetical protein